MRAEAILVDDTQHGIIHRFFYPINLVQIFRPCGWEDFHQFIHEDERFRSIMSERIAWIAENNIKCHISFTSFQEDENVPTCYQLFTGFTIQEDAELYKGRWDLSI